MALEQEALFLRRAVRLGVLDADKGTAALYVYSQLSQMGAQFSFGQFLVDRGLLTQMALEAVLDDTVQEVQTVSIVGDFKLLELIAETESGAVFKAEQQAMQRMVALKILNTSLAEDPEICQRFIEEARATARLNHPNIVQGINVGESNGLYYFAMELVEGGSARGLLDKSGQGLSEIISLKIALETAEGLKAAHAAGIIHRDLKPDNILLSKEGRVKVADLGISQSFKPHESGHAGDGHEFWASPPYVAPEVVLGHAYDVRSDIYSLGATLFELLVGHPPYQADAPEAVLQMHVHAPIPDLHRLRPDVSIQTASLVKKMLAKDVNDRVPNATVAADALRRILRQLTQPPPAPPSRPGPQPDPRGSGPNKTFPHPAPGGAKPRPINRIKPR